MRRSPERTSNGATWRSAGDLNWELASPEAFDTATRFVRPEDIGNPFSVSSDPGQHAAWLNEFVEIGFSDLYLHQMTATRDLYGRVAAKVLPEVLS
jgi:alkanesulfonate monooxygenase SsuD/methylene tetrahydromethanopterin reductase-like flavin-dependent oxidoreductase (luciferase family)